jgi:glucose-1-phosphate cytidylyltransferase
MKVVILAGGLGTRLAERTDTVPKPMVEIGGRPIMWHIMKGYAAYGYNRFVVALGYRGETVKDYFVNYRYRASSLTVSLGNGEVSVHDGETEDWTVDLLDTGERTETGGRVKRAARSIGAQPFMLTYGDGVSNVDIRRLVEFHRGHGKLATMTAIRHPARFGVVGLEGDTVVRFEEKPQIGEEWVNGGFFVLEPGVESYVDGDSTAWEREPMQRLAKDGQLVAYQHEGFWQSMDTLRDVRLLESLWQTGKAPWKVW